MAAVVMCLRPVWALLGCVFCAPWIKLHDAETLGGQTGDSTHSVVRGGEIPLPVCLSKRILCHRAEMTSSCSWLSKPRSHSVSQPSVSLSVFSQMVLSSSWAHICSLFPQHLINQVWLSVEKMQLSGFDASLLVGVSKCGMFELNIKSGLGRGRKGMSSL